MKLLIMSRSVFESGLRAVTDNDIEIIRMSGIDRIASDVNRY